MAQVNESGTKAITIDFSDKSTIPAKGKVSKLDPTQDSFAIPCPPPKGLYDLKIMLGKNGIEAAPVDDEKPISDDNVYFRANMECVITNNPTYDKQRLFPMVTTRIGRGKDLSTMADLIVRLGYGKHIKDEMSDFEVAELFNKVVAKEPVIKGVECDWEGYSKEDGTTVFRSMEDFPADGKGGYEHIVNRTTKARGKEQVVAQLKVKRWPMGAKPVSEDNKPKKQPTKAKKIEELPKEVDVDATSNNDIDDLLS